MQAVVFCRPVLLAAQVKHPYSGRGCPQQVSKANSHICRGGGGGGGGGVVCHHPPGNLSDARYLLEVSRSSHLRAE